VKSLLPKCSKRRVTTSFKSDYKDFLHLVSTNGSEGKLTYTALNDHVKEIVIDNPTKKNALSGKMLNDLANIGKVLLKTKNDDENLINMKLRLLLLLM
jgi:hypothetical protein